MNEPVTFLHITNFYCDFLPQSLKLSLNYFDCNVNISLVTTAVSLNITCFFYFETNLSVER